MLEKLKSIINGDPSAMDRERAFTFVEFVKFLPDGDFPVFQQYLSKWNETRVGMAAVDTEEFVHGQLLELMKSITLNYSSYEEQYALSKMDWDDPRAVRDVIPFYAAKILEIARYYRKRRRDARQAVRKRGRGGTRRSIEEIVRDNILRWVFENSLECPTYKQLKRDLAVSVETFVDTCPDYFDIPRDERLQERGRGVLTVNMNTPDPRDYLEVSEVISGMFYGGKVHLNEIPLVATLALDLNQECVGDLLAMKNTLLYSSRIDQVEMDERVALRRRLYEKFLGCDLWYAYKDSEGNVTMDTLCTAKNKSGNLLNATMADTATTFSGQLKALSHIGLFFKPDKNSIVKVNARAYSWYLDPSLMEEEKWYVFPNPNQYGDIGTNKMPDYPVVMECKTDWDIRNISSGEAIMDPMVLTGEQNWRSYHSRQEDLFRSEGNDGFGYAFTGLAGHSTGESFQTDMYGNMFAVFKEGREDAHILPTEDSGTPIRRRDGGTSPSPVPAKRNAFLVSGGFIDRPLKKAGSDWDVHEDFVENPDGTYSPRSFWAGDEVEPTIGELSGSKNPVIIEMGLITDEPMKEWSE